MTPLGFFDPLQDLTSGRAKFRCLLVGVNEYRDDLLPNLNYAIADCRDLTEALSSATTQFPNRKIRPHYGLLTQTLTAADIHASLEELLTETSPRDPSLDTFLLYFAGHGMVEPDTDRLFLCLPNTDVNHLAQTGLEVSALLKQINDTGVGKQVIILDACHSGNLQLPEKGDRGMAMMSRSNAVDEAAETPLDPNFAPKLEEILKQYATRSRKNFHALLSCEAGQKSWELDDLKHGTFTYCLIEGIQGKACDEQGRVDIDHLYRYVRNTTEHYVFQDSGKSQTPSHIKAASRDVVIGFQPRSVSPVDSRKKRESDYGQRVWHELNQQYPLSENTLQQLRVFAEKLRLSPNDAARIEQENIQDFERDLENYKQRAVDRLHQIYPHPPSLFFAIRQEFGVSVEILSLPEADAQKVFEQHQQEYTEAFSQAIHQQLPLSPETEQALRQKQQELGLCDAAIAAFQAIAKAECDQHQQEYREVFAQAIHQHLVPDVQELQQKQQELRLGDALVRVIEAEETEHFNQEKQQYREIFVAVIHQQTFPNFESLRQLQQALFIGDAVVEQLEREATDFCDRHKQEYRHAFATAIRQQEHLSAGTHQELHELQERLGLSPEVIEVLENSEHSACEQDKARFREAFQQAIHQENSLTAATEDRLRQLQAELNLGDRIVDLLKQSAYGVLAQNKQWYREEYVRAIRSRYPLSPVERSRLNQRQQQLGLSHGIVDALTAEAIAALEQDKQAYRQALDSAIRQHFPLDETTTQQLQQLQQERELSNANIEPITVQITADFERNCANYCDAFVSELNLPETVPDQIQQRLLPLQQHLRLGDQVVAGIEQMAISAYEANQLEQQTRERHAQERKRALEEYQTACEQIVRRSGCIEMGDREWLENLCSTLQLEPDVVSETEARIVQTHEQKIQRYEQAFVEILQNYYAQKATTNLDDEALQPLKQFQQQLELGDEIISSIQQRVTQTYEDKIQQLRQAFRDKLYRQNPSTS